MSGGLAEPPAASARLVKCPPRLRSAMVRPLDVRPKPVPAHDAPFARLFECPNATNVITLLGGAHTLAGSRAAGRGASEQATADAPLAPLLGPRPLIRDTAGLSVPRARKNGRVMAGDASQIVGLG